ncbi:MAG TPA: ATP-dependent DNA ligase [Isosphaeraceae bacterium]
MKAFAELYAALDETTKTNAKVEAMVDYFRRAPRDDAAWAVYFLIGRKPRQVVPTAKLRAWAAAEAGISDWLFEESYHAVGDLAEAIALILPEPSRSSDLPLRAWVEERLLPLREADEETQRAAMTRYWSEMDGRQRFVWNKLITGAFRVGVSQLLVTRALARLSDTDAPTVAHRLMGDWEPTPHFFERLLSNEVEDADVSRLFPFCLAHPLEGDTAALGPISEWQVEWKWDGIRGQLIRREGQTFLWSRGEELVTDRYPELAEVGRYLPDGTTIDGEILAWKDGRVLPFAMLQKRIGRKTLSNAILSEVPVALIAYDLLEYQGEDIRGRPLEERRSRLEEVVRASGWDGRLIPSPILEAESWDALAALRETSRERGVEGMMLKRRGSIYRVGRVRGDWWKWKVNPLSVDAVLIAAQRGSGKRASLYTDYTFGVWSNGRLVPIAKAYSGLTDEEIRRVDRFVRANTVDKFGPVRSVKPELVFELAFEGIQRSTRHKSGVAVRFPRIARWRDDKVASEADSLAALQALLPEEKAPGGPDQPL